MPELNFYATDAADAEGAAGQVLQPQYSTVVPGYNYGDGNTPGGNGFMEFGSGTPGSLPFRVDQAGNVTANNFTGTTNTDWINVKAPPYNAKGNNSADDTAAINAAIAAAGAQSNGATHGGTVYFPEGSYLVNGSVPLVMGVSGVTLRGNPGYASAIVIGPSYTGTQDGISAMLFVNAAECSFYELAFSAFSSTTTSNPACNAVEVLSFQNTFRDVQFRRINGWAIEVLNQSSTGAQQVNSKQLIDNVSSNGTCAGGIHFGALLGGTIGSTIINSGISAGVTSGPNANLDALFLDSAEDMLVHNWFGQVTNNTTGSVFHARAAAPGIFDHMDIATDNTSGSGPCILIEDSVAGGHCQGLIFSGIKIVGGNPDVSITGGSNDIQFVNCKFDGSYGDGVDVSATGANITFSNCEFGVDSQTNGQGATGGVYDLNWSGSATGTVQGCRFGSAIVGSGKGVVTSVNLTAGQNVAFTEAQFTGTGASSANWFTGTPAVAMLTTPTGFQFESGLDQPWLPGDNNLLAANADPAIFASTSVVTAGLIYLLKVPVRKCFTWSNIWLGCTGAGSNTGGSTGTFVGLYSSTGTLLSGSADIGGSFAATPLSFALTTPQALNPGSTPWVWAAFLPNLGTTQPTLAKSAVATNLTEAGLTASAYRFATYSGPATTVAAGSNGGVISAIATWTSPSAGVLDVASTTGLPPSGTVHVAASGATTALVSYTGTAAGTLTGCAYISGSAIGTVATGGAVSPVTATSLPASITTASISNSGAIALWAAGS
jgi:hypothetical protein